MSNTQKTPLNASVNVKGRPKKSLLISVATHGDEGFSIPIVKQLAQKYDFTIQINNPKALKRGVRYVDKDLNRVAPGKLSSSLYEVRRAVILLRRAQNFSRVIDIHGSISNCGVFVIVSDLSWENIELARTLPIKNIVLWPSFKTSGPLTQFIRPGIEIECGPMSDPKIGNLLLQVLDQYLSGKPVTIKQRIFIVSGYLKGNINQPMQDFMSTSYQSKVFYPLLVDQYPGIKCYTLQLLSNTLVG